MEVLPHKGEEGGPVGAAGLIHQHHGRRMVALPGLD